MIHWEPTLRLIHFVLLLPSTALLPAKAVDFWEVTLMGLPSAKFVTPTVLETVTATAELLVFPAASRAMAVKVCAPLAACVVFQETPYGFVVLSLPRLTPSNWNCTPTTPT